MAKDGPVSRLSFSRLASGIASNSFVKSRTEQKPVIEGFRRFLAHGDPASLLAGFQNARLRSDVTAASADWKGQAAEAIHGVAGQALSRVPHFGVLQGLAL